MNRFRRKGKPTTNERDLELGETSNSNARNDLEQKHQSMAFSGSSDEDEDRHDSENTPSRGNEPRGGNKKTTNRFMNRFKKPKGEAVEATSDGDSDSDSDVDEDLGAEKQKLLDSEPKPVNTIFVPDFNRMTSEYDWYHNVLHGLFLAVILTGLLSGQVICFTYNGCSIEWWNVDYVVDPAVPTTASRSLLPNLVVLLCVIVPGGYWSTRSENFKVINVWAAFGSLYVIYAIVLCGIYLQNARTAETSAQTVWDNQPNTLAHQYYEAFKPDFVDQFHLYHKAFGLSYLFIALTLVAAVGLAFRLGHVIRTTSI